jgi:hypothetical protein
MTDMDASTERKARVKANNAFYALGRTYHDGLALHEIDTILRGNGFTGMEPAIYCGRDGQVQGRVGRRTWITLAWHKMEYSGRYEIVVYLN